MAEGSEETCSFCSRTAESLPLEQVADLVEAAFEVHFERTSTEPSDWDYWRIKELDYDWEREGEQVHCIIAEIAGIEEEVAEAIVEVLEQRHSDWDLATMGEESEFDSESRYQPKSNDGYNRHRDEWSSFERRIQNECRFLSKKSQGVLDEVFSGIEKFGTRDGKPVIRVVGPTTDVLYLFRARVFQSSEGLIKGLSRPDLEIGPPPIGKAASGRMNAQGISVFYGALHSDTAVAEVRPPVGSDVVVARFEILRPLRVLDITALKQILIRMSYFDPDHGPLLERVEFLKELSGRIARPAMPEREHVDYLVTQVIADYLAAEHGLDGLIFPSVQRKDGVNIVLFHHACRTEELDIPEKTEIQVGPDGWSDEGPDSNYLVRELRPAAAVTAPVKNMHPADPLAFMQLDLPELDRDPRPINLRISLEQVEVRTVTSVAFSWDTSAVRRRIQHKSENGGEDLI